MTAPSRIGGKPQPNQILKLPRVESLNDFLMFPVRLGENFLESKHWRQVQMG